MTPSWDPGVHIVSGVTVLWTLKLAEKRECVLTHVYKTHL